MILGSEVTGQALCCKIFYKFPRSSKSKQFHENWRLPHYPLGQLSPQQNQFCDNWAANRINNEVSNWRLFDAAVNQNYTTTAEDEYVIRGNDVLMKCKIPSFVSDYVIVVGWLDNDLKEILPHQVADSKGRKYLPIYLTWETPDCIASIKVI